MVKKKEKEEKVDALEQWQENIDKAIGHPEYVLVFLNEKEDTFEAIRHMSSPEDIVTMFMVLMGREEFQPYMFAAFKAFMQAQTKEMRESLVSYLTTFKGEK